jgi:sugar-specific transcriptional regulator TrmB
MDSSGVEILVSLGFTPLEAEVYLFLLTESPATGYRVAQALGRPVSGVYKTLDSLTAKGALLSDEGGSRLCRAVPYEELLSQMERSFNRRKAAAATALAGLGGSTADDRIYQLSSYDQMLERCRSMLSRADTVALVDAFPAPVADLQPELAAAAERGVKVGLQVYADTEVPGARVIRFPDNEFVRSFPGGWLIAVVDGAELLHAFLDREERVVRQAIWTGSPHLAFTLQAFMTSEFSFVSAMNDPEMPAEAREVARRHGGHFPFRARGYQQLVERYGTGSADSGWLRL